MEYIICFLVVAGIGGYVVNIYIKVQLISELVKMHCDEKP
jgi:hypothetical protein